MRALIPILLAAPVLMSAVSARADAPPKLDVASTCRSSGSANPDSRLGSNGCLRSENEAHDRLKEQWARFGPDAKRQCSQQSRAGGFPSYVELLTCLELATGTVDTRPGEPAATGSTGRVRDMPSTDADPRTRIDPKAVLGKSTGSDD